MTKETGAWYDWCPVPPSVGAWKRYQDRIVAAIRQKLLPPDVARGRPSAGYGPVPARQEPPADVQDVASSSETSSDHSDPQARERVVDDSGPMDVVIDNISGEAGLYFLPPIEPRINAPRIRYLHETWRAILEKQTSGSASCPNAIHVSLRVSGCKFFYPDAAAVKQRSSSFLLKRTDLVPRSMVIDCAESMKNPVGSEMPTIHDGRHQRIFQFNAQTDTFWPFLETSVKSLIAVVLASWGAGAETQKQGVRLALLILCRSGKHRSVLVACLLAMALQCLEWPDDLEAPPLSKPGVSPMRFVATVDFDPACHEKLHECHECESSALNYENMAVVDDFLSRLHVVTLNELMLGLTRPAEPVEVATLPLATGNGVVLPPRPSSQRRSTRPRVGSQGPADHVPAPRQQKPPVRRARSASLAWLPGLVCWLAHLLYVSVTPRTEPPSPKGAIDHVWALSHGFRGWLPAKNLPLLVSWFPTHLLAFRLAVHHLP